MEKIEKRGRPLTFLQPERKRLAKLIRKHGIAGTRRKVKVSISSSTLLQIAREFEINLPKGRRPNRAA
jgi:hypothetical protein